MGAGPRGDLWALRQAAASLESARRLTRERGHPPTNWSVTFLWPTGHREVHPLPPVQTLKSLVRRVRELRRLRRPQWLFVTGKLTYRSEQEEMPHILVVLAGEERCVLLHAAIDSDGNAGPPRVRLDPDPALLGPLARLGR